MEAIIFYAYIYLLGAFILWVSAISGLAKYIFLHIYTYPKIDKILTYVGKTFFGVGQSLIGAVIYAVMTQTGVSLFVPAYHIAVAILGILMIVVGVLLNNK